jgi:hypothetical protein
VGGVLLLAAEVWPQAQPVERQFARLRVDGQEMADYLEPGEEALGVRLHGVRSEDAHLVADYCRVPDA